ncbi:MAG: CapA family protein [Solirubrobacterales bacterium]
MPGIQGIDVSGAADAGGKMDAAMRSQTLLRDTLDQLVTTSCWRSRHLIVVSSIAVVALVGLGNPHWSVADERDRPARFTVSASGDLLIHTSVWEDALAFGNGRRFDFDPMFRSVRRYIAGADLAICHVETPITTGPPSGYPIFSAPAALAAGIRKAGWRACDTASNHSLDQGQAGIRETSRLLNAQKVRHTGSAASRRAARRPVVLDAGPAKVGLVAYTDATNGIRRPHGWSVNLLPAADPARKKARIVRRDVKRTLAAGADTVIVNVQWGDENSPVPNHSQRALARRIVKIDGVAAIAGQGPHVVQPIDRIGGKFVIFSSGNLLSNQSAAAGLPTATQDGMIALLGFAETARGWKVKRVDYVPTLVEPNGHRILATGRGRRNHPGMAGALTRSWRRTVHVVGRGPHLKPIPKHRP